MANQSHLRWPIATLVDAYRAGQVSPVEVTREALDRIEEHDGEVGAFVEVTRDLAIEQATVAERRYAQGEEAPLLGVPISVKDSFYVEGALSTLGSRLHRSHVATADSGVTRRLRGAGAVFTGKTNMAEFGQSATTDNLLDVDTRNPWDPTRTTGGSSGGAAASVAAGLSTAAVGSDGGGSIRIPAAFTGLVGFKPTFGRCPDEWGFRGMSDFVCPGPLTRSVADARAILAIMADDALAPGTLPRRLTVAYCPRPEGRPVEPGIAEAVDAVAHLFARLGHDVEHVDLPLAGWDRAFGPLVLDEEHRERGHLLEHHAGELTSYERGSLRAALNLRPGEVEAARESHQQYRWRVEALFADYDVLLTPTVATPAFPLGERPQRIGGEPVGRLWGAFPFAVPFNVAGVPAASLPCGTVGGLPVAAQLVARAGADAFLLDVCEQVESALAFDDAALRDRWDVSAAATVA